MDRPRRRRAVLATVATLVPVFVALWIVFFLSGRPAGAAGTICVKPGGGDGCQASIAAAIGAARAGDTIRVRPASTPRT